MSLEKEGSEFVSQSLKADDDHQIASFTNDDSDDIPLNTSQTSRSASKITRGLPSINEKGTEIASFSYCFFDHSSVLCFLNNSKIWKVSKNGFLNNFFVLLINSDHEYNSFKIARLMFLVCETWFLRSNCCWA